MCVNEGVKNSGCTTCRPYKDGCLLGSLIISIFAFACALIAQLLSLGDGGWFWTIFFWVHTGIFLGAFILIQLPWCYPLSKCGLITGGVLGLVGVGIAAISLIDLMQEYSTDIESCERRNDDDEYYDWCVDRLERDYKDYSAYVSLYGISFGLWIVASLLVFIFSCGKRYSDAIEKLKEQEQLQQQQEATAIEIVPVHHNPNNEEVNTAVPTETNYEYPVPGGTTTTTTTTTISGMENESASVGPQTIEIFEVINPDGSKTSTVTTTTTRNEE